MPPSFPPDKFRFGKWWPNPGEPAHILILGKTGSGKSDLVQRLYRRGDFGANSFVYVTDKPLDEPPIKKMIEHTEREMDNMKSRNPSTHAIYNSRQYSPNFCNTFTDTNGFLQMFDLKKIKKNWGDDISQHTVIVFDDDHYPNKLELVKKGRSQGVSCIMVQQDWRGDSTKDSQNRIQISGAWFVGPFTRNREERLRYGSSLGLNASDIDKLENLLKQDSVHAVFVNPNTDQFTVLNK